MKIIRRQKPRGLYRKLAVVVCVLLTLAAVFCVGTWMEKKGQVQERQVASQDVGVLRRVDYDGATYMEKTGLTSILLMGIDRTGGDITYGARQGGQADFLMLAVLDHKNKAIRQLQIERDTIAEVETLGILGNPIGTRAMQICLAHAFGTTAEENCRHTQSAVEKLLEGIEIDFYLSLDMDAIGVLNDALGGVTVTLQDDYSAADPAMIPGATLRLSAAQAEIMVRNRMDIADGSNEARMKRQQTFVEAAAAEMKRQLSQEPAFINTLLAQLEPHMTTDIPQGRLLNEINQAYHYELMPIETLAGQYRVGEDGFMEFHHDQGETARWVMNTFFIPES